MCENILINELNKIIIYLLYLHKAINVWIDFGQPPFRYYQSEGFSCDTQYRCLGDVKVGGSREDTRIGGEI